MWPPSGIWKSWVLSVNFPRQNMCSTWRRLLAAAVVACACVWFAPRQAEASCGDYVMIGGHTSHQGGGHTNHLTDRDTVYSPMRPAKPTGFPECNGPGCRQRREAPVPEPTRIMVDEQAWGLPPRLVNLTLEASLFVDLSIESATTISVAAGIYRPPRA